MIDHPSVQLTLRERLLSVEQLPTPNGKPPEDNIAWENRDFTPPTDSLWVREIYMAGDDVLRATNLLEAACIVEYDVITAVGKGINEVKALAKKIGDNFQPGTGMITADGKTQIAITRTTVSQGRDWLPRATLGASAQIWWIMPVQIHFRAFGQNQEA